MSQVLETPAERGSRIAKAYARETLQMDAESMAAFSIVTEALISDLLAAAAERGIKTGALLYEAEKTYQKGEQ